jgi:uncharacterized protein YndB with AHSA1/START domain
MTSVDGQLEERGGRWHLRFTRRLPHPPEKVWSALTEPEHLEAWFPTTIDGERAAGAKLRFEHRDAAGPAFEGEMLTYDPPSALEFTWGGDVLRFELRPSGDGTELTLVDTLVERGKAARDAAGWHACLDVLAASLADEPVLPDSMARWREVHPDYVERLGPEAATIGPPEGMG